MAGEDDRVFTYISTLYLSDSHKGRVTRENEIKKCGTGRQDHTSQRLLAQA